MHILRTLCFSSLFFALQSQAAIFINVSTLADENGENMASCSLREAITAVNTLQEFGGCRAGDRNLNNIIQLKNGTYLLTKGELFVRRELTIQGVYTNINSKDDSILRIKPKRMPPSLEYGSIIDANFSSRLFNTAASKSNMSLNNVMLVNGKADIGGAILAGGQVNLSTSVVSHNTATVAGGAIYLQGRNSQLNSVESTLSENTTPNAKGAVLAMSCVDDLQPIARDLNIIRSSILNNGSATDKSIIEGCSSLILAINASTIAKNTASASGGILSFAEKMTDGSTLTLSHSTIVENKIAPALLYRNLTSLNINSTVIAFNDQGCAIQGDANTNKTTYLGAHNAFQGCSALALADRDKNNQLNLHPEVTLDQEFMPLANYGGYTLSYLPKITATYVSKPSAGIDELECANIIDQRTSEVANHCDIGSVQKRHPIAVSDNNVTIFNLDGTDRIAQADVLSNDVPSETDQNDDIATARGDFAKDENGVYDKNAITITQGSSKCQVISPIKDGGRPLIQFDNQGEVMAADNPFTCKYKFTDSNGKLSTEGIVLFRVDNKPPVAGNDSYTLASGTVSILLNLTSNDNDDNDGKFGGLCSANDLRCNDGRFIRIDSAPELGVIIADKEGSCPDSNESNNYTCYGGNIYYRANNSLSVFTDKFTYVVYDIDKAPSNAARVTILSQNAIDEQANSGAIGIFSLFSLIAFAFYRRLRK